MLNFNFLIDILQYPSSLNKTIKTHRLEKTPLKDSFIKVVEQNGNRYQSWFSSLQKHSSKKIGAIGLAIEAMLDVLCVYWCVTGVSKWISKD